MRTSNFPFDTRTQLHVRRRKNSVAPTHLGHCVQECVGNHPRVGDQVLGHCVSSKLAEHHEADQPEQVRLQKPATVPG
jgi:hypothetical protein